MGQRQLHRLPEGPLHVGQAPDIVPGDPRDLDEELPKGRRADPPQGLVEVLMGDDQALQDLGRERFKPQIQIREDAPEGIQGGLTAEGSQV